jgi:YHS domain-containing protein
VKGKDFGCVFISKSKTKNHEINFCFSCFSFLIRRFSFCTDAAILRKKNFNLENGIAIRGYDPVAYFTGNKAIRDNKNISAFYDGAIYYFSSAENKGEFQENPAKYEPQYGGWCAYAMGKKGEKVEIDPGTFKIIDGKLYLYYNKDFNNTLNSWNKDEANLKAKADVNWRKIYH